MSKFPPGSRAPGALQTLWYMRNPLELFRDSHRKFGDLFTLRLSGRTWVFVCSPELTRVVYGADPRVLKAGAAKASVFAPVLGTTSSLVLDGDAHLARRRMLLPSFHGDRMLAYTNTIREATERTLSGLPRGKLIPLHPSLQQIALRSVANGIFGQASKALLGQIDRLMTIAASSKLLFMPRLQRDLGRFSPWGRVLRVVRDTDTMFYEEIARARSAKPNDTILSLLLSARDESGRPLSDREIRDELTTMVITGHEITAISLAWALAAIIQHRGVAEKIREELVKVTDNNRLAADHVDRLDYLDAVIKESMRLYPAVANGSVRVVDQPFEIGGYTLERGTLVTICVHQLHRRPDLYPDPERFLPERFLDRKISPYEWIPFGGGLRRCLGMAFALHEMKIVLATLCRMLRFELAQPEVKAVRRGAFMMPQGGPRVRISDRPNVVAMNRPDMRGLEHEQ